MNHTNIALLSIPYINPPPPLLYVRRPFSSLLSMCLILFLDPSPHKMDPIKIEKLQAMKRYNRRNHFLSNLIQDSLVVVMFVLFLSSPLWLPYLCSSIKLFFMVSLPKIGSIVFGPKFLFVIFNLIIAFLVGESRLSSSSSKLDIYEEYVNHSQSHARLPSGEGNGNEIKETILECPLVEENKEEEEEVVEKKEESEGLEEEEVKEDSKNLEEVDEEEEEEEEERGLHAEELNKRAEDFIARINMQMRLEARMLVCCG